jgi:hypothetical protein
MTQPPPLDYRPSDPRWSAKTQFFAALVIGSLLSGVVWTLWFHSISDTKAGPAILVLTPVVKLVIAVVCLFNPNSRPVGGGLLASIGIGFLIFFGLCAVTVMKGI